MTLSRVIFHIDVNSAFLSWSAVKLVLEGGQDLRLIPSVVSGDPKDRRIPAKKLGVKVATPVSMALRTCPDLVLVRGDWEWYKRCSQGFIDICRSYSPVLQQFSIDECFIDMSERIGNQDPVEVATRLKDEIKTQLGFTVNVGVGSNKLLAKMASDFEKPDKVHTLWESEVREKMWPLGVRDLLWVGKKTEERLLAYGIRTIGDLAALSVGQLTRLVGQKLAAQLHENANGHDDSPVETEDREAKSYSAERTFPKDLSEPKDIDRAFFTAATASAHRPCPSSSSTGISPSSRNRPPWTSPATSPPSSSTPPDASSPKSGTASPPSAKSASASPASPTKPPNKCPSSRTLTWNIIVNGTGSMIPNVRRSKTDVGVFEGAEPLQSVEDSFYLDGKARRVSAWLFCRGDVTRTHDPLLPKQMR